MYRDFFRFLDAPNVHENLWEKYRRLYFAPHKHFLSSYWRDCIGLGLEELRKRVQSIKPLHYSHLSSLLSSYDLEGVCISTLEKCNQLLQWADEPTVYLMVGFFSPDGFVLPVAGKPVIGIGLERYRSFRNLPVILAHECCHYVQSLRSYQSDACTVGEAMLREGVCIAFSRMVFPERPINDHLGVSRRRFNWMLANESLIWQNLAPVLNRTGKDSIQQYIYGIPNIHDGSTESAGVIPGRSGLYMGYRMAKELLSSSRKHDIKALLEATSEDALEAYNRKA